jgi:hypothetical protein
MSIDFDDFTGGFADREREDPKNPPRLGLVVASKAESGHDLVDEAAAYKFATAGSPGVIFAEEDEDGNEIFANARAWADAMGIMHLPTEQEALAWEREHIAARLALWHKMKNETA